jgi:A nuclease of the HNH/ENDO VII superfamily with conserved WHH
LPYGIRSSLLSEPADHPGGNISRPSAMQHAPIVPDDSITRHQYGTHWRHFLDDLIRRSGKARIEGYTWHHHQETGRMQLLREGPHGDTGHMGWESLSKGQ